MTLAAGTSIGPYRIVEPVGRGGMASVFKAYEASLDRYVALKVLPPEFLHDPAFAERFRREAQTIARLEHPQIIPIFAYDIDAPTHTPWMAMRLISGGSLSQRIRRERLAPAEIARILRDVGDALDYAHQNGVIHRDVKPQNILLDDAGRVYLADFGIAKMVEATAAVTQTGMITGTPQYMAPEQALGKSVDKAIDIYALGIVAYELFTGRVPFSADTPVAVLMKQASEPMPLPPTSEVPEAVTRAILRATAKDPAARWASAGALAKAIAEGIGPLTPVDVTAAMPSLADAGSVGTAPTMALPSGASPATARRAATPSPPASPGPVAPVRKAGGSGIALAAIVALALVGLGVAWGAWNFFGRRSDAPAQTQAPSAEPPAVGAATPASSNAPDSENSPASTPTASSTTVGTSPGIAQSTSPAPGSGAGPLPSSNGTAVPPAAAPVSPGEGQGRPFLTPAERKALLARGPMGKQARREAMMEARREMLEGRGGLGPSPGGAPGDAVARSQPALTSVVLAIEATQPSTGTQVSVLFAEVTIDGRVVRRFPIRFTGASTFARWKREERVTIDDVPLNAREITLAVGLDPGANDERIEGSTTLSLNADENRLDVVVRFYNQFDRSVKFR